MPVRLEVVDSVGLQFSQTELNNVYRALKAIETQTPHLLRGSTGLTRQFSKEFRDKLNPVAKSVGSKIPAKAPLSGLNRNTAAEPWGWKKPRPTIRASKGKKPRPGRSSSAVSIRFKTKSPNHGFYIIELAQHAQTPQGDVFMRNLAGRGKLPVLGGLGRTVIPAFRDKGPEVTQIATEVVNSWVQFINRNLRNRGRI